jgi:hypothetical protein
MMVLQFGGDTMATRGDTRPRRLDWLLCHGFTCKMKMALSRMTGCRVKLDYRGCNGEMAQIFLPFDSYENLGMDRVLLD